MIDIAFLPDNRSVTVQAGTTILEAARLAGAIFEAPCNGTGSCGKCRMKLLAPASSATTIGKVDHQLPQEQTHKDAVLACQTEAWTSLVVEIVSCEGDSAGTILSHGENLALERNPFITKEYVSSDDSTVVYAGETRLGLEKGNREHENFGVVVDIGTTTLVAALVDINTGRELTTASALNPQANHAQDVLSRITFSSNPDGLFRMYSDVTEAIKGLIVQLADEAQIDPAHIYEVVYSGNTCMLHLAIHVDPHTLGKYPYTPIIAGGDYVKAGEHHLGISDFGLIYLPPIVSAYVGADITSGILASRLYERSGATLFVDIGTNGEMALAVDGRITATSTAAGPAFEGMNIACGMRAGTGAIERFKIDSTGNIHIKTIGGGRATGICGSGLMDIVAELVDHGMIAPNGRFQDPDSPALPPLLGERLQRRDGQIVFILSDNVHLSQKDIRQVQLAKGAVRAGIEYLLASQGIDASLIDRVLIAGSFGYHVRAESLVKIGLLPAELSNKIELIGNTSQSGGRAFLLNRDYRREMTEMVKGISVIELANSKDFEKVFVRCLRF
jgi:uncharacterized 2Fe-2S/4Fe-4S cluster protein (DUF4445 family)